jgi:hypothetical protein
MLHIPHESLRITSSNYCIFFPLQRNVWGKKNARTRARTHTTSKGEKTYLQGEETTEDPPCTTASRARVLEALSQGCCRAVAAVAETIEEPPGICAAPRTCAVLSQSGCSCVAALLQGRLRCGTTAASARGQEALQQSCCTSSTTCFFCRRVSVCTLALVKQVSRASICTLAQVKQVK